jgi:NTE family protein
VAEPIHLKDVQPAVDPSRIGISYSGGGSLVIVELGIARAFVKKGIVPVVITGASAGALAGAAHALDPLTGKGIELAAEICESFSNSKLGLDPLHIALRVLRERTHLKGLGDNSAFGVPLREALRRELHLESVTIGHFRPPDRPKLMIVATDVVSRNAVWFPDETPLEDALIASTAIPGVFPWHNVTVNGLNLILVDGGVVMNQPLSNLVEQGCGTLYACAVGSIGPLAPPQNLLENALRSVNLAMHQATKLEEDYVRLKLGTTGAVHHIHPEIFVPANNFDFTPAIVRSVMAEAEAKTLAWLDENHPD